MGLQLSDTVMANSSSCVVASKHCIWMYKEGAAAGIGGELGLPAGLTWRGLHMGSRRPLAPGVGVEGRLQQQQMSWAYALFVSACCCMC